jgi:hypothetical protein
VIKDFHSVYKFKGGKRKQFVAEEDQAIAEDRAQEDFHPAVQGRVAGPYGLYGAPEQPGFSIVL